MFQVTNVLPCILFNTCVLALFLYISNTISHNHFSTWWPSHWRCRPKHVEVSYIYILLSVYCCSVVRINIIQNYC